MIKLTALLTLVLCASIYWIGWSVIQYDRYDNILCEKNKQIIADREYYDKICTSAETILKLNAMKECVDREHSLHKTPESMAWAELVQGWGGCMGYNCLDGLSTIGYLPFIMMGAWGLCSILILTIIICIGRTVMRSWLDTSLPLSSSYVPKHKKHL